MALLDFLVHVVVKLEVVKLLPILHIQPIAINMKCLFKENGDFEHGSSQT